MNVYVYVHVYVYNKLASCKTTNAERNFPSGLKRFMMATDEAANAEVLSHAAKNLKKASCYGKNSQIIFKHTQFFPLR